MPIHIKLLTHTSRAPERKTSGASCWDVFSNENVLIPPGGRAVVKLGFALEVLVGWEVQIRPRSGLALRDGILVHFGTIDSDYRGEVGAIVLNLGQKDFQVSIGDRIAQMAYCMVPHGSLRVVDEISQTDRGAGGFGSTGV